jgi:hypothetical protein
MAGSRGQRAGVYTRVTAVLMSVRSGNPAKINTAEYARRRIPGGSAVPESRSLAQVKHKQALRRPKSGLWRAQCRFWHARLQYRTLLQPWHQGLTLVNYSAQPVPDCH